MVALPGAYERVTGRLGFVNTIERPGMLHARILRATTPHARIRLLDARAARDVPGVHAVLTGETLRELPGIRPTFGPVLRDQPIIAIDRVRFVGEPVAAVAAEDLDAADEAIDRIQVEYEELPAVFDAAAAIEAGAPLVHEDVAERTSTHAEIPLNMAGRNVCHHFKLRAGDAAAALRDADFVFEDTFSSPAVQHVPLEAHGCVADAGRDHITMWAGSQIPFGLRRQLADLFGLPASSVQIIVPPLGGGYGGKGHPSIEPLVAVLSLIARRPVRLQLRREEEFVTVTKHAATIRIVTGVQRDGTLLARKASCLFNTGAYADVGPRVVKNAGYMMAGPYRIPNVWVDSYAIYTNTPPAGAFRAFGVPQAAWAYESQMDMIAERLGIDPLVLRLRNLLVDTDELPTGQRLVDGHFAELLADVASGIGWSGTAEAQPEGRRVARAKGLSVIVKGTVTPSASSAVVKLNHDGSVNVLASAVEMGQDIRGTLARMAAAELQVPVERVVVSYPDTDVTPYDQQTSSSRSTFATGAAVREAARVVRSRLLQEAADQLEIAPTDLQLVDGRIVVAGSADTSRSIPDVLGQSGRGNLVGDGSYLSHGGLDPETGRGIASVHWHQAAGAAEVSVDLETGRVEVVGFRSAVFAGTVINPVGAALQAEGNLAFGLGQALWEELVFDGGQLQNANLGEYMVSGTLDLPEAFAVTFLEHPDRAVIHGLGETSLPTVMPAIANAVFRATGVRVRDLPITPEKVLRGLAELAAARAESGSAIPVAAP